MFDLADETGVVDMPSEAIARTFEMSRLTWLRYRDTLEFVGLLAVSDSNGRDRRILQLLAP